MKYKSIVRGYINQKTENARKDLDRQYETYKGLGYSDQQIADKIEEKHKVSKKTVYDLIADIKQQHISEQRGFYRHSGFSGSRS